MKLRKLLVFIFFVLLSLLLYSVINNQIKKTKDNSEIFDNEINIRPITSEEIADLSCEELEARIFLVLDKVNYCSKDNDCIIFITRLSCPFGCFHFRNKKVIATLHQISFDEYLTKCPRQCLHKCAIRPTEDEIVCRNNKCVYGRFN